MQQVIAPIIAPVDGSLESWRGVEVAIDLGRRTGAQVHVLSVEFGAGDRALALDRLRPELAALDTHGVDVDIEVRIGVESVAQEIQAVVDTRPGSIVVMSTHGRGRSSALVGSVADDVLQRTFGPILLVGPRVENTTLDGPVLITVDGSETSERAVPLGVSWAIELGLDPWIIHSIPPMDTGPRDVFESAYVANVAQRFRNMSGHEIDYDEVHGRHPATAVADYADRVDAAMIVASSHGRTGLDRLTMGSVVSGFVRHAHCPVLVIRDPHQPTRAPSDALRARPVTTVDLP